MNVQDIVNRVKRTFGDEAGVQVTDADIIRWINDAQLQISIDNNGIGETTATSDTIKDQGEYDFPSDLLTLRSTSHKGLRLDYLSLQEFTEYVDGYESEHSSNSASGTPQIFTMWNKQLKVFPKPNKSETAALKIYYIKYPTSVSTLADEPDIPIKYHRAIVDYCLQQAYELDEDSEKSMLKKASFDETMMKLNGSEKETSEYYPRITVLPEDDYQY